MERARTPSTLRIGLAAARNLPSVEERLHAVDRFLKDAGAQGVAIVCFPETYIPGLRGQDSPVYANEQLLVHDIDLARATGLCARRFKPAFYPAT